MPRTTICLNMIVRNERHIVREVLEAVAPYIDYWVIVDTGSEDGTPAYIRTTMAELKIPGELYHRPWQDFGHNRSEALRLAQGHADYIWVMDADDTVEGTLDFDGLTADCYWMRIERGTLFWRPQLFRDGMAWRYRGVVHERAVCDEPHSGERLEGDYRILSRALGARSCDPLTHRRDCEALLAEVRRDPTDVQAVFHLAKTYSDLGEFANARYWFERRIELGGVEEQVYYAMFRRAAAMDELGEPWAEVMDAYLQAWEYRPTRAEALSRIAYHYLSTCEYELAYMFAVRAAAMRLPERDTFFVYPDVYLWRAADELAVAASWTGRQEEALEIWSGLLGIGAIPESDRQRMAANRDLMAAQLLQLNG